MSTSKRTPVEQAFAVWLTGLPASGKSTIAAALVDKLVDRRVDTAVLESDAMRKILMPGATYRDADRDTFYAALLHVGSLLVDHGVPVIFDATANRRAYRDRARIQIKRFVEVYVTSPLAVCMERDPKGIYRRARKNDAPHVPGLQAEYEPPQHAELTVAGDAKNPQDAAACVVAELERRGYIHRV